MSTEERGHLTGSGRVVRTTKSPLDPGLRRAGVRLSLDGDVIVGRVLYRETRFNLVRVLVAREWIVEAPDADGGHDYRTFVRATGSTRADAVARFLEHLELWRSNPTACAAEARREEA